MQKKVKQRRFNIRLDSKTPLPYDVQNIGLALNDLTLICRTYADKWWRRASGRKKNRNKGEMLMLMVSELAEAMEGERKDLMDTHLKHRKMVEVEFADAIIRLADYAGEYLMDIGGALFEKLAYNYKRKDHKAKARAGKHGKKF